jgi:hypothetical protein
MTNSISVPDDQRVYARRITDDNGVTGRALRKWITDGKFPQPDGNLNGRNFWLAETYSRWKADVLAGKYSQRRRPGSAPPDAKVTR